MNRLLERIESAKHVVVVSCIDPDADSLSSASAFYTHLLRLHKKVSFFCCTKDLDPRFVFLPWFEKIRSSFPSSADLVIALGCVTQDQLGADVTCDIVNIDHHKNNDHFGDLSLVKPECISTTQVLIHLFKEMDVKINKKMATALYAGLLQASEGFLDDDVDGTVFADVSELLTLGAEHKICNDFIMKRTSLGAFRLKAIMFKKMQLKHEARVAVFCIDDDDMRSSGALSRDCETPLQEALSLASVEVSLLLQQEKDLGIKGLLFVKRSLDLDAFTSSLSADVYKNRASFYLEAPRSLEDAKKLVLKKIYEEM